MSLMLNMQSRDTQPIGKSILIDIVYIIELEAEWQTTHTASKRQINEKCILHYYIEIMHCIPSRIVS